MGFFDDENFDELPQLPEDSIDVDNRVKSISEIGLNYRQKFAADIILKGYNVFITGDAGTGKTYSTVQTLHCKEFKDKEIAYCALTGTAALGIKGVTLHRFLHLPAKPLVDDDVRVSEELMAIDMLFVDEIGMARIDAFEYMAKAIIKENERRERNRENGISNKKSIQLVLTGDFFQLPPVITESDREVLKNKYGNDLRNGFAFQSEYWNKLRLASIYLNEIMRQQESEFIYNINKIRYGNAEGLGFFNYCCCPRQIEGGITVCGTNKRAAECNRDELAKIDSRAMVSVAKITGEVKETDKNADDVFECKVGARVMAVVNNYMAGYLNGMLGTVVEMQKDIIIVKFDDLNHNVAVTPYTWEISTYRIDVDTKTNKEKLEEEIIGTFTQFPLKLGYAITIHKSQGKTFEKVNFEPYCWDNGQLYVGLSRAKSSAGLHVVGSIRSSALKTSEDVKEFYRKTFKELENI